MWGSHEVALGSSTGLRYHAGVLVRGIASGNMRCLSQHGTDIVSEAGLSVAGVTDLVRPPHCPVATKSVMQHCMAQHSPADGVLPRKPAACYFTVTVASPVISNPPRSQAPTGKPTTAMGCEPLDELVIQHCLRAIGAWWHPDGSQVLASNVTHQSTLLFFCKPCCCEPGSTEYFIK